MENLIYRTIRLFNDNIGFPLRRKYLIKRLLPLFPDESNILDIGCSDGRLAFELMRKNKSLSIHGVDKVIQKKSHIPVTKVSSLPYPFADGQFEVVMLIDVLHHEEYPHRLLAEAMRISRKLIIIKDHYYNTNTGYKLLKSADFWGNKAYGIPLPYKFLRPEEWEKLYGEHGLTIKHFSRFRYNPIDPCRHNIFVLEKT